MKSPDRFMARGLAEGRGREKGSQGRHPEVPSRSGGLEGGSRCRGPSFEARKSAHLTMTAVIVEALIAAGSATAAAAAAGAAGGGAGPGPACGPARPTQD